MRRGAQGRTKMVGRTPWSAADALVGLCGPAQEAGQGAGCGPGGPPHHVFEGVSTLADTSVRATKTSSDITEPGIGAALFQGCKPAAQRIQREDDECPNQIDDRQGESPSRRRSERIAAEGR